MSDRTIGFVGLGAMGEPMVARLLDAGFPVVSYVNRSREAMDRLKPRGLIEVGGPAELGAQADVVMCCVWDEAQNDLVLRGDDGALQAMSPGSVVMCMSTISPGYCQKLAEEAAAADIQVVDCPLSGRVQGAADGTLTLMIGGSEETIAGCADVLAPLGTVSHCGPVGSGQVMKLANNAIVLSTYSLLHEVRDMVEAYGMEADRFLEILNRSTGKSVVSETFPLRPGRMKMAGMPKKDVSTCLRLAEDLGIPLPMVQQCFDAGMAARGDG